MAGICCSHGSYARVKYVMVFHAGRKLQIVCYWTHSLDHLMWANKSGHQVSTGPFSEELCREKHPFPYLKLLISTVLISILLIATCC